MTEQEAIDGLRFTMDMMTWRDNHDDRGAYNVDPSELNEDSRLTYDSCKSAIQALQKQIPQKAVSYDKHYYKCPNCDVDIPIDNDSIYVYGEEPPTYCSCCGQKLSWN